MGLGILTKIRRHAAVAGGNFGRLFKDIEIPPLPEAASRLIEEVNKPDPDLQRLVRDISASPETAACVIRTVNSSLFSLRNEARSVQHAVTLLGLKHIRPIVLSYAVMTSVPQPPQSVFRHRAFWSDSVIRAIFARLLASRRHKADQEEAFTAMLLADLALPVLLVAWGEYYHPIVQRWSESKQRLSRIEQENFNWNHAQAAAWILSSWGLPEELVCCVGLHTATPEEIRAGALEGTIALPLAVASMAPSCLKLDRERARAFIRAAVEEMFMDLAGVETMLAVTRRSFSEIQSAFNLSSDDMDPLMDLLTETIAETRGEEEGNSQRRGAA
ncbi:MAG: HDOD domain-containing protein [Candidatus Eisenbacteria bacterium]|nr:HDOD domain-containing protein [Candidatus Eisenbacteria bacterium]